MENIILVVEDSDVSALTIEIALASIPDVTVARVLTGREALDFLRAHQGGKVRAVLTDLQMPSMDGFELIEKLRGDERMAHLPILVVSGDTNPSTPERLRRLGADGYFPKPFSPAQIRQKLEQLLNA